MNICTNCSCEEVITKEDQNFFDVLICENCGYWTYKRIDDCCRNPYLIITARHLKNNSIAIYRQCINCGGANGLVHKEKALSFKKYSNDIQREFSDSLRAKFYANLNAERSILAENKKYYNLHQSKYPKYMASDEWQAKRLLVLKRDKFMCQECKVVKADQVHHKTYANLGNENLDELLSVCFPCHLKIHSN